MPFNGSSVCQSGFLELFHIRLGVAAWNLMIWQSPKHKVLQRTSLTSLSQFLSSVLFLMMTHLQTRLISFMSAHHSVDLLAIHGNTYLVVHGTSGSTSSEMILSVPLKTSGGVQSAMDRVVQWHDGPHQIHNSDDSDETGSAIFKLLGSQSRFS